MVVEFMCETAGDVLRHSQQFLKCMSDLVEPTELAYYGYTSDSPLHELSREAQHCALATENNAIASLTIRSGNENSFMVKGTHALGTIHANDNHIARLWMLTIAVIVVVLAFIWLRQANRP